MSRIDTHLRSPQYILLRHRPKDYQAREYFVPTGPNSGHWVSVECPDCWMTSKQFDHYYNHVTTPGGLLYDHTHSWIIRGDYRWEAKTL